MNTGFWSSLFITCLGLITLSLAGSLAASSTGVADTQKPIPKAKVTFNKDVAPIVFNHCAVCHHTGGSGPFRLLNYQDVRSHARQIAVVTASHYMPLWLLEPGYVKFVGECRLSDQQIQTIQQWVAEGMQEGVAADLPSIPTFSEDWQLGKPDLVEAKQGKLTEAISQFQAALRLKPNDPLAQQSLKRAQTALEGAR